MRAHTVAGECRLLRGAARGGERGGDDASRLRVADGVHWVQSRVHVLSIRNLVQGCHGDAMRRAAL